MGPEAYYERFATDRRDFFANVKTIDEARKRAYDSAHSYDFIAPNENLIRQAFNSLIKRLREDKVNQDVFWYYCYYCAIMLQRYHLDYGQKAKAKEFFILRKQIRAHCDNHHLPNPKPKAKIESFASYLVNKIADSLVDLSSVIEHPSELRDKLAYVNVLRIYWFFSRNTIVKSLYLARDWRWLEKFSASLGRNIDVEKIRTNLEVLNGFLRVFSVGFYVLRLIINVGMIIKHVWYPTEGEKQLDWKKRFANEIYKRHGDLLNDFIWGPVNMVANYNRNFHIHDTTAGWIFVVFLIFDVCLILWRRYLAEKEYLNQRLRLTKDLEFYQQQPLPDLTQNEESLRKALEEREMQIRLLTQEISDLDITWQARNATYLFNAGAALLIVSGFGASLIFSPPIMGLACYAIVVIAIAMYLSDGAYNQYKEKKLLLNRAQMEEKNLSQATIDYTEARNNFIWEMVKNAAIPTFTIALYALCWEAAVVLTVAYLCYQLYKAYSDYSKSQQVAVEEPVEEREEEELGYCAAYC